MSAITDHEAEEVERANASGKAHSRGHALTIDTGWRQVTDTALGFVSCFAPANGAS